MLSFGKFQNNGIIVKQLLLGVCVGLVCSLSNANSPVELMALQNINAGDSIESVEGKYGKPKSKFGTSRTYNLQINNSLTNNTTSCLVKVKYTTNKQTQELQLDHQIWKSDECKLLMEKVGYSLYAQSKAYKLGDKDATFFFDYNDSAYSEELNKTSFKVLVDDLKNRNITSIALTSYETPEDVESLEIGKSRAITIKNMLDKNGLTEGVIYQVEKVQKSNCLVDAECLVEPWVIKLKFK